ncbi:MULTISPECIES: DUF484 family protein [Simplicispira]|jgi:uncharacterized protein YigA (DUF484 family)|uniref:DUF484 family protein n=1 Tax=Simplicispira metamorpha TaxID=80881 RepID=A0A4R2N8Z2_9BURK|nr:MULTISPECIES: DUF484 family protein [Simplicispira]MBP8205773.1 DUF484 family protein [Giesbergeria sp.]MDD2692180.1 DUF484 family protein [Simplicispira sp.]TCP17461.1 hypothetical protein EV674_11217 [Simplicispira metamorpha]
MSPHSPLPQIAPITEEDIVEYLAQTPGFFERHAELLTSVQMVSPHGHRAVSLQERQAEMLRDKIKGLEQRVMDMVRNAHENAAIAEKVHQWGCDLQRIKVPTDLPDAVVRGIRTLFDVPQAAVRVWSVAPAYANAPVTWGASDDVRAFATSLTMPFCGPNLGFEPVGWLRGAASSDGSESNEVHSLALLPLRDGPMDRATPAFGMLVLASHDPHRFEATMGTDFLTLIAEMASAALARLR